VRDGNRDTPILLSLEEVSGAPGSIVTTTLSIDNLAELSAMNLAIVYDTRVVEKITKVSKIGLTAETGLVFHDDGNGILRIGVSTQTPISGSGALATLTLQLVSGGNVNSTPLSIAQAHLYNRAGHDFGITLQRDIQASHGKVTITTGGEPSEDYNVSGTVIDKDGNPVAGVTVLIDAKTAVSNETGNWEILELAKGQYEVTAHKDNYVFALQSFNIEDSDVVINIIEKIDGPKPPTPATTYKASGTIIDKDGNPISGITIQVKDKTAVTDDEGKWKILGLVSNHYLLTASGKNYHFEPQVFAIKNADVIVNNVNPDLEPVYTITGQLLDDFGKPIPDVTVEVNGDLDTTDEDGNWEIANLPSGLYTLTAFKVYDQELHQFAFQKFTLIDTDRVIDVDPNGRYGASSTVTDKFGNPIAGIRVQVSNENMPVHQKAMTGEKGYWEVNGLFEGNYEVIASKNGYTFVPNECGVSLGQDCEINFKPESVLDMKVVPEPYVAKQGENVTYTITITNGGNVTATGITLRNVMLAGASFVSINSIDGGSCDGNTMVCSLPNLKPSETTTAQVVMSTTNTKKVVNKVTMTANEYPADIEITHTKVKPPFSVSIRDKPDPVEMGKFVHYNVAVELSQYAPSAATGVKLEITLPSGVELQAVNSDHGVCDVSQSPKITCSLINLSIASADSISQAKVGIDIALKDAGLLMLTATAKATANDYPADTEKAQTKIFIPEGIEVDIAFVIDVTGSMQEEINGVIKALQKFIAEIDPNDAPLVALVVFTDDVKVKAFTHDLDVLLRAVNRLEAGGGGTCPEASAEALLIAIPHTKQGGSILFSTDASPYENADIDGITEQLRGKGIRFNAMITGDCTHKEDWNELPSAE
jgi:uncharacterized repeat protein (TIGR01451 family)